VSSGAALSLRARLPGGRRSNGRGRALKLLLLGSIATFAGLSSILGLVIGAERLLVASVHVQTGIRSAAVSASVAEPVYGMARFPMSVTQQWFEVAQFIAARETQSPLKFASIEATALAAPKLEDRVASEIADTGITGSIGVPARAMASVPAPAHRSSR